MRKSLFYVLIVVCLLIASFASFYSNSLNRLSLYIILPFSFILSFLVNDLSFKTNRYISFLWGLYAFIAFTALYAVEKDNALRELNQILGVILISFVFGVSVKNPKMVSWLYFAYIVIYLSVWYYAINYILGEITLGEERLDDDKLNANMLAYFTFYLTFSVFMLGIIIKKEWISLCFQVLFLLTIPLTFLVAIYTASRQVFIIQIPLISILLYTRYFNKAKLSYKLIYIIAFVALCIYAVPKAQSIYENSYLRYRNEQVSIENVRIKLAVDAFNVGFKHFFTGVGAGNYSAYSFDGHFSHNTYLELFANTGIVGISLFVYLMILFISKQFRRYKATKDKMFFYFFWFGIIYAFDCIFYVFYPKIWYMGFFILVASHSEQYYKRYLDTRNTQCYA